MTELKPKFQFSSLEIPAFRNLNAPPVEGAVTG